MRLLNKCSSANAVSACRWVHSHKSSGTPMTANAAVRAPTPGTVTTAFKQGGGTCSTALGCHTCRSSAFPLATSTMWRCHPTLTAACLFSHEMLHDSVCPAHQAAEPGLHAVTSPPTMQRNCPLTSLLPAAPPAVPSCGGPPAPAQGPAPGCAHHHAPGGGRGQQQPGTAAAAAAAAAAAGRGPRVSSSKHQHRQMHGAAHHRACQDATPWRSSSCSTVLAPALPTNWYLYPPKWQWH
jgi:hypothetical protein